LRPDSPLLPNYKHLPIGYHGRASSIVASGTEIKRPRGQIKGEAGTPEFGPSRMLDYELEVGFFVGRGNRLGDPIPIAEAERHIFGACLVNDWSARDIQTWEYQPLGPFLGKSFATTISAWVVPMEALEPYRVLREERPADDPEPLDYLREPEGYRGAIDLTLEVYLESRRMRQTGIAAMRLSEANLGELYWTPAQLLAHHTSNGCNLRPGDLLATGTVSGRKEGSEGCLLEKRHDPDPIRLPNGELRTFLEDGDRVTMRGFCQSQPTRRKSPPHGRRRRKSLRYRARSRGLSQRHAPPRRLRKHPRFHRLCRVRHAQKYLLPGREPRPAGGCQNRHGPPQEAAHTNTSRRMIFS
jgi:fumarylacetoacetase